VSVPHFVCIRGGQPNKTFTKRQWTKDNGQTTVPKGNQEIMWIELRLSFSFPGIPPYK